MHLIRHRERPMARFELNGAVFKMLTGRWKTAVSASFGASR